MSSIAKPRKKRSPVWSHCQIEEPEQDGAQYIKCLYCPSGGGRYLQNRKAHHSTGNMKAHLIAHHPELVQELIKIPGQTDNHLVHSSTLSPKSAASFSIRLVREKLLRWIVASDIPFNEVEEPTFRELIKAVNTNARIPTTGTTIKSDLLKSFHNEKAKLKLSLQSVPNQLSFTHDIWTSMNRIPFLGVTAHWIDKNWFQHDILLAFESLPGKHTGEAIASTFSKIIDDFGIKNILAITLDNASNNDTFITHFEAQSYALDLRFNSSNRIRCFAHILNLAMQSLLHQMNSVPVTEVENQYDEICDTVITASEPSVGKSIMKIRSLVCKIRRSPQKEQNLRDLNTTHMIQDHKVILDVKTRWNSTYLMLARAKMLRKSLDELILNDRDLHSLKLDPEEWDNINAMLLILKDFELATNRVSQSKYPTLTLVLPIYSWLNERLSSAIPKTDGVLKLAYTMALEKLNEYFQYTFTEVYWINLAMNPTQKLEYFKENYDKDMLKRIKATISKVYRQYYSKVTPTTEPNSSNQKHAETPDEFLAFYPKRSKNKIGEDELTRYLRNDLAAPHTDILEWWKAHSKDYPIVAEMARDYLAIPGTSVPSERVFSTGTDFVVPKRCSMKAETITCGMCLKDWFKNN